MDFDFTTDTITADNTNILTIGGTTGLEIPIGTTAQRPISPEEGTIRYNIDLEIIEGYSNGEWRSLVEGSLTPTYDWVDFTPQIVPPLFLTGRVYYDENQHALTVYDDVEGTSVQLGYETLVRVKNMSGQTIENGSVVYISGGSGDYPTIDLAETIGEQSSVLGLLTHDLLDGDEGKVLVRGVLNDVNTEDWPVGTKLYLSSTVPGQLTDLRPSGPVNAICQIGIVVRQSTNAGRIYVNPSRIFSNDIYNAIGGQFPVSQLNNGSNASSSTFWRGDGTWNTAVTSVNLISPAAGITASGGPITTSGNITLSLSDDLQALESLTGSGIAVRTGNNTWSLRSIEGTAGQIVISNGNGVSGNVNVSIEENVVLPGNEGIVIPNGTTLERPDTPVESTLRFNEDLGYFESYINNSWTDIVDGNSARWIKAQTLIVQKTPGPGEFSSVAAAIASITDNSVSKPYVVNVLAGNYNEPQIVMKEFVTVFGSGTNSTILNSVNTSADFVIGCRNSGVNNLSLNSTNASAGTSLILLDDIDIQSSFICQNITLRDAYQYVKVMRGSFQFTNGLYGGQHVFTRGFESVNNTTGSRLVLRNVFSTRGTQPYPEWLIKIDGVNAFAVVTSLFSRARGAGVPPSVPAGNAVWIRDGGQFRAQAISLLGWDKGIWSEFAGAPPQIYVSGCLLDANQQCLAIEHPETVGSVLGTLDASSCVDESPFFSSLVLDDQIAGTRVTGNLYIGRDLDAQTNVTDLIQESTPVGILSGGQLSLGTNALEIDITGGVGYRSNSVLGFNEKFTWNSQTFTVPDNQFNFIFFNISGQVAASPVRPDYLSNILLGAVYTRNGVIERLSSAAFDAQHQSSKIDNYLRTVIGAVVTEGLTVSEGSAPLKLDVSAGTVAFGTVTLSKLPSSDILFSPTFHSSGNWTYGSLVDTVPTNQYDNGTNLVNLSTNTFTKHVLYLTAGVGTVQSYLLYGQAEYATLQEARDAVLPTPPLNFRVDTISIVALIVQEGESSIIEYIDIRPKIRTQFQLTQGGSGGITVHGDLDGLSADDHPQYLLVNGTRAMIGNLDLGSNNILNSGTINGINISSHGTRHNPNGSDPISTASAVSLSLSTTNSTGTANSLARSDHTHQITGVQPLDSDLSAIADFTGTGLPARTADSTWALRAIDGGTNIAVTNGNGVAGNPSIAISGIGANTNVLYNSAGTISGSNSFNFISGANPYVQIQGTQSTNQLRVGGSTQVGNATLYLESNNSNQDGLRVYFNSGNPATSALIGYSYNGSQPFIRIVDGDDDPTFISFNSVGTGTYDNPQFQNRFGGRGPNAGATTGFAWQVNGTEIAAMDSQWLRLPSGTTAQRPTPAAGMSRYNTSLNTFEFYNGTAWVQPSTIAPVYLRRWFGLVTGTSGNTTITWDNSTPLITEGTQIFSQTITPLSATSKFEIQFTPNVDATSNNRYVTLVLFRGSTCIAVSSINVTNAGRIYPHVLHLIDEPATVSSITYSVRVGIGGGGGSWFINSSSAGARFNGLLANEWIIREMN